MRKKHINLNTAPKQTNTGYCKKRHIKNRRKIFLFLLFSCLLFTYFIMLARVEAYAGYNLPDALNPCELLAATISNPEENNDGTADNLANDFSASDDGSTSLYDFSKPVPVSDTVEDTYFEDAVFIGDSRTEGLILNTGLSNTTSYVYKGLMVNTVFTKPVIKKDGEKISVMDALKTTDFSKVYIMFGINETGWAYSRVFQKKYGDIIDAIQDINPRALIYIQGIMPVSDKVSSEHQYITNAKISEYNRLLQELAKEKKVYYIDTENAVISADGSLPEDAAYDGIHLVKEYCEKWLDYLKTHTVE